MLNTDYLTHPVNIERHNNGYLRVKNIYDYEDYPEVLTSLVNRYRPTGAVLTSLSEAFVTHSTGDFFLYQSKGAPSIVFETGQSVPPVILPESVIDELLNRLREAQQSKASPMTYYPEKVERNFITHDTLTMIKAYIKPEQILEALERNATAKVIKTHEHGKPFTTSTVTLFDKPQAELTQYEKQLKRQLQGQSIYGYF